MGQRNVDKNSYKEELRALKKSRASKARVATTTKVSKPESKASVLSTMKKHKAEDDREADGEPEAKKIKPDEHERANDDLAGEEGEDASASGGLLGLGYASEDSSEDDDEDEEEPKRKIAFAVEEKPQVYQKDDSFRFR